MCSVIRPVKPVQRALSLTLRLRAAAGGLAQDRRLRPAASADVGPLRATCRSYCSSMSRTEGLLFRQVRRFFSGRRVCVFNVSFCR